MGAPRFFVPGPLAPELVGGTVRLPEAVAHHALRVVRLGLGAALTLFDGRGGEYAATLVHADRQGATARLERFEPGERESPLDIVLAQGVAANDAMDYAVRKATELGVTAIQPLVTARSAPLPDGERGERRAAHWRQIAIAACEQCGRNRVPDVRAPRAFGEWLAAWSGPGIVLAPESGVTIASLAAPSGPLAVAIGPEGGFDARELRAATERGFAAVRLGPRVLRTETAAAAVIAVLQSMWGDWR